MDHQDLIDKIYEAAFIPELWPDVIQALGAVSHSASGAMLVFDGTMPIGFKATQLLFDTIHNFCTTSAWRESRRIQHFYTNPLSGFALGSEYFPPEIVEEDERLLKLKKLGFHDYAGTIIPMPTGEIVVFALHRKIDDDAFSKRELDGLNEFYGHLARSSLMSARLRLQQAHATAAAMAAFGLPAAVLTNSGRVLSTNLLLENMPDVFVPLAHGRMCIGDTETNKLLQEVINAQQAGAEPSVRSVPLMSRNNIEPMVVHALPLRRSAHDVFSGGDILIVASPVTASSMVPSPTILMGLFDLTPAETKVSMALASGKSLKEAALENHVTVKTARSYLERIFAKTGTRQQSQLVALLKSTAAPGNRTG
ncbi:DNA-binding CsgD family transcriptional regulator [Rhodopseudomonas thermotolerans]|uniref:DNA-binding CsgD family transcriptional regulator n=2 Tax=Rhodopseudomonas TaxID=1073 RepID=A0A336JKJ8_9BRAD|nr:MULTISPECIES: helix-turn-helix transcriptional regulator [Rhodopseudomonas]RED37730.1 DNA-binding CsgD family transcriptional regulator [Rhodopseudomonas pentothenatexigens]REG04464.1 DNA-binding CsgD family transcriptional regulator [Rhodopseudomonas thermotolerans]SSW90230.1 DNA-binding CsgD family transcriptional regulator [Rhodopseudomonas pentothenatexigens]